MKTLALLTLAGCIIACDATPTSPIARLAVGGSRSAVVVVNDRTESEQANFNYCDGTAVVMQMTWHSVSSVTFDAAGGGHFKDHFNLQGQGSDAATGVSYVANDVGNIEENFKTGFEATYVEHYNLIAKGNAPNADLYTDFHFTVTPNGDVTSDHSNFRVKCQ